MTSNHSILGLARPRSQWFRDVTRWCTTGSLPALFTKCVSAAELLTRIEQIPTLSAVLVDLDLLESQYDIVDMCAQRDVLLIGVTTSTQPVSTQLCDLSIASDALSVESLNEILQTHCSVRRADAPTPVIEHDQPLAVGNGRLVAFIGPGNTGVSTIASACAQALGANGSAVLVDLKRSGDLAMMHDAPDVVPNVEDLVAACKAGVAPVDLVAQLVFEVSSRKYDLMLGMVRPSHWTAMSEQSISRAVGLLKQSHEFVVADLDCETEGHDECGSWDVEERHALTRSALRSADNVVFVGNDDLKGIHVLARLIGSVSSLGIDPRYFTVVINRASRSPIDRLTVTKTLRSLTNGCTESPIFLPDQTVANAVHDVRPLPRKLGEPLLSAIGRSPVRITRAFFKEPERITVGSLGRSVRRSA